MVENNSTNPREVFLKAILELAANNHISFLDVLKTEGRAHPELMMLAPGGFTNYYGYFQFEGEPSKIVRASFPQVGIGVPQNTNQADFPFYIADEYLKQMEGVQVDLERIKNGVLGMDCIYPKHLPENFQVHLSNSEKQGQVVFGPPLQISQSPDYPTYVAEFQVAPALITVNNQSREIIALVLNVPTYFWPASSPENIDQNGENLSLYRPTQETIAELLTIVSLDFYQSGKKGHRIENLDFVYQRLGELYEQALGGEIEKVFGKEIQPDQPWEKEWVCHLNQQGILLRLLRTNLAIIPQLEVKAQV